MKECIWLKPESVARIDFLEWTGADHLRHIPSKHQSTRSASNDPAHEESMSEKTVKAIENGRKPLEADHLVPNGKDVSTFPGNEEGSVQPTTVTTQSETERENSERERRRLEEERKHHEQIGS
jgi:hypothetical protein